MTPAVFAEVSSFVKGLIFVAVFALAALAIFLVERRRRFDVKTGSLEEARRGHDAS